MAKAGAEAPQALQAEPTFAVGDTVSVGKLVGVVKFCGPTEFAEGTWYGVELNEPKGKNDGSVKGVKYFTCPDKHGVFAKKALLLPYWEPEDDPEVEEVAPKSSQKAKARAGGSKQKTAQAGAAAAAQPSGKLAADLPTGVQGRPTPPAPAPEPPGPAKCTGQPQAVGQASEESLQGGEELALADFEAQKKQYQDIEGVRATLQALTQTLRIVAAQAAQVEKVVATKEASVDAEALAAARARLEAGRRDGPEALPSDPALLEKWLNEIGSQLRHQLSEDLHRRADGVVSSAVGKGAEELIAATRKNRQ